VNVPLKGYKLKLELALANAKFRNYKSELFREDKSVQTDGELTIEPKGDQFVVPVTIIGEMLSPGDYQVRLSGVLDSGADEFIEKYSFRVSSKSSLTICSKIFLKCLACESHKPLKRRIDRTHPTRDKIPHP
jgi:hypothetical protein